MSREDDKKKKKKKQRSIIETEIQRLIQASLKKTIDQAMNDILKDFK